MTRQEIKAFFLGLLIAAFLIWGIGFAFAQESIIRTDGFHHFDIVCIDKDGGRTMPMEIPNEHSANMDRCPSGAVGYDIYKDGNAFAGVILRAEAGQTLELPIPTPTPTPEAFSYHYRLSVGPDGTTVTMHAIEGGPTVKFSCVNCGNLVGGEK